VNRRSIRALAALLLSAACNRPTNNQGPGPGASAVPTLPSSAPEQPEKKQALPWHTGSWSGNYEARHHLVASDSKEFAVREWAQDDAGILSGKGSVTLQIDTAGHVRGSAEGALGSMLATGEADETTLRVSLVPRDPGHVSSAFLLAQRENTAFKGRISASTGDSLTVRQAHIELQRVKDASGVAIDGGS